MKSFGHSEALGGRDVDQIGRTGTGGSALEPSYKSKLKRAKQHLDRLRAAFLADQNAGRFRPAIDQDADPTRKTIKLTFRVPEDRFIVYSLMAGDCIQNLRATLDHLAHTLTGNRRSSQFPIFSTVTEYAEKGLPLIPLASLG